MTKDPRSRIELPTPSSAVFVTLFAVIVHAFQSKQAILPQTAFQEVTLSFAILTLGFLLGHAMRVMTTDSRRPTRTVCGHGWWRPSPYDGKLPLAIVRRLPPGPVAPPGKMLTHCTTCWKPPIRLFADPCECCWCQGIHERPT